MATLWQKDSEILCDVDVENLVHFQQQVLAASSGIY
jgi:hypothetical protein